MAKQTIKSPVLRKSLRLLEKYLKETPPDVLKKHFEKIENDDSIGGITWAEYKKELEQQMGIKI